MDVLKRSVSVFLLSMAVWVFGHFVDHTFLEDHATEALQASRGNVQILDILMGVAFVITVITAYLNTRQASKSSPLPRTWFVSSLFFYITVLVAAPFFANWIASLGHTDEGFLWIFVETAGPLTWVAQALRLWNLQPKR